ncbi:MAG: four helix bundle suffix domain-containing protein [Prevotella denticola]|nr:four helix bundle suffix domain-containing protein [Prevotella denticola]
MRTTSSRASYNCERTRIPAMRSCSNTVGPTNSDYEPFVYRWTDEEFCNTAVTLLHITDRMMSRYHEFLQKTFVEQGGIKERMYAARTGYRRQQDELLKRLQQDNAVLKAENDRLRKELAKIAGR